MKLKLFFTVILSLTMLKSCKKIISSVNGLFAIECELLPSRQVFMTIEDKTFEVRKFEKRIEKNTIFYDSPKLSQVEIKNLLKKMTKQDFNASIKSLIVFSNAEKDVDSIKLNEIHGLMVYEFVDKNTLNTRIFENENNVFRENKMSNLKSHFITTNDFHAINKMFNNNNPVQKIIFLSNLQGFEGYVYESELQKYLEKENLY